MKNVLLFILFVPLFSFFGESQLVLLTEMEDSLIGKIDWKRDSVWINNELTLEKEKLGTKELVRYRLVKIGSENFYEGPFYTEKQDTMYSNQSHYGDSLVVLRGMKVYMYIGNSSWGYYTTYHLLKIKSESPIKLSKEILDQLKIRTEHTCEHGWDQLRGQACPQCLSRHIRKQNSSTTTKE